MGVQAYPDSPRLIVSSSTLNESSTSSGSLQLAIDLLRDHLRVVVSPGANTEVLQAFNLVRGLQDTALESAVVSQVAKALGLSAANNSSANVLAAAVAQGIPFVAISSGNLSTLNGLNLPADAKAQITQEVTSGSTVLVPSAPVMVNGQPTVAWFLGNPQTGEVIGVNQDGKHASIVESAAFWSIVAAAGIGLLVAHFVPKRPVITDPSIAQAVPWASLGVLGLSFLLAGWLGVAFVVVAVVVYYLASHDPAIAPITMDLLSPSPALPPSTRPRSWPPPIGPRAPSPVPARARTWPRRELSPPRGPRRARRASRPAGSRHQVPSSRTRAGRPSAQAP